MNQLRTISIQFAVALVLVITGCAKFRATRPATTPPSSAPATEPVIVPAGPGPARIAQVNEKYKFVVVDFRGRVVPPLGTRFAVYRQNRPVATLQLTGPVQGRFATADILEGEPRLGDEIP